MPMTAQLQLEDPNSLILSSLNCLGLILPRDSGSLAVESCLIYKQVAQTLNLLPIYYESLEIFVNHSVFFPLVVVISGIKFSWDILLIQCQDANCTSPFDLRSYLCPNNTTQMRTHCACFLHWKLRIIIVIRCTQMIMGVEWKRLN